MLTHREANRVSDSPATLRQRPTCAHSSHAFCPGCTPGKLDSYLRRHSKNPQYPHPDRHPFTTDGLVSCVRCELPEGNRIHTIGGF